jgi:hypothetical protein
MGSKAAIGGLAEGIGRGTARRSGATGLGRKSPLAACREADATAVGTGWRADIGAAVSRIIANLAVGR